ncbi:MAG: site-2 protease family protein [Pirellulales bacterium]
MSKFVSSTDRILALRLRPDLVAVPVEMAGTASWVVKDPLTLEHFHFSPEEHALLEMLRRRVSLAEMAREFAQNFPPRTITEAEIWSFLSRLHEAGLVTSDAPGQGDELLRRDRKVRLRRWSLSWAQLTAIRFRGVNPDAALTAIHRHLGWLFSRTALLLAALVVLFAGSLLVGHFDEFRARLPELSVFADWRNLIWLFAAIGVVKCLHELGHALACKHFGGEVPEMGVILLVFLPALYTDVSDAWRLPSKWQRIAVSAAGMGVELVLASLATIVWWYSQPGLVQLIALDVMVICTVHTLAVNGNPLLRYDGYYILADLVESPNLWQRSRDALVGYANHWLLGDEVEDDALVPMRHRSWLAGYALASKVYSVVLFAGIVWGLVLVLYPHRLETLAYMVGLTLLGGTLVQPAMSLYHFARNPLRRRDLRKGRVGTIATAALVAAIVILAWPVHYYVRAPLVLLPTDAMRVYATVDGTLTSALPAGRAVAAQEPIAQLTNADVAVDLARLTSEHDLARTKLDNLERLRGQDEEAGPKIPAARAALADLEAQLADRRRDAERLTLSSPVAGTIIPVPNTVEREGQDGRLPTWSGNLLDEENRGAAVEPGTLVCLVGNPHDLSAVLLVDDTNAPRLSPGQHVRIKLDQSPGAVLAGEVLDVARHDAETSESTATARADLAQLFAGLTPAGRADKHYQVRVKLDAPPSWLAIGGRGEAKISAERITFARWLLRYFAQTFRLPT